MKFKIIGSVVLIIMLLLSTFYFLITKEEGQYKSEVTVEECGDNYQKASEMLIERYLSHYCSPIVGLSNFITDYKIIEIDNTTSDQKNTYHFVVTYSVKMFTNNDWIAGNGVQGKDNWVNEKIGFVSFYKDGNKYILDGIGTGQ